MEAIDELAQLSVLADEDLNENSRSSRRNSTFMNVVALGNTGAGKSAVLNSLIGHPALPTGEGGATRAPICIDLKRDDSLSSKSIVLQIGSKSHPVSASALQRSLLDRLSKNSSENQDKIYLKLRTSTAPPLKLVDLPGVDKGNLGDSLNQYAKHSDATLLVIIPASEALDISSAEALRIAKEFDGESTRTIGVISKIDQAASESKVLSVVQALLNQGSHNTYDMPWVALIDQSVSIASAQSGSVGSDSSLETAWRAERESLKSLLAEAPQSKLGRLALVETLAQQIRKRMNVRSDEVAVKAFHDMMAARDLEEKINEWKLKKSDVKIKILKLESKEREMVKLHEDIMTWLYVRAGFFIGFASYLVGLYAKPIAVFWMSMVLLAVILGFVFEVVCPVSSAWTHMRGLENVIQELIIRREKSHDSCMTLLDDYDAIYLFASRFRNHNDPLLKELRGHELKKLENFKKEDRVLKAHKKFSRRYLLALGVCCLLYSIVVLLFAFYSHTQPVLPAPPMSHGSPTNTLSQTIDGSLVSSHRRWEWW